MISTEIILDIALKYEAPFSPMRVTHWAQNASGGVDVFIGLYYYPTEDNQQMFTTSHKDLTIHKHVFVLCKIILTKKRSNLLK